MAEPRTQPGETDSKDPHGAGVVLRPPSETRRDWIVWAVLAGGLVALVLLGSLSVQHGPLTGLEERVVRYWPRFTGLMRAWGFPRPLIIVVWAMGAVAAVTALVGIRLAIAVPDGPDDDGPTKA